MAKKKMTVEMTEPFVWPEEPVDYKQYVLIPLLAFFFPFAGKRR